MVEADPVVSQEVLAQFLQAKFKPSSNKSSRAPTSMSRNGPTNSLGYVVTESLSGRADRIKAYTIAVEVFGRSGTFDPQSDPVVRIEGGSGAARIGAVLPDRRVVRSDRDHDSEGWLCPCLLPAHRGRATGFGSTQSVSPRSLSPKGRLRIPLLALSALAAIVLVLTAWAALQWFDLPRTVEAPSPGLDARGPNIPKLLVEPFQDVTGTAEGATIAVGLTEEVVGKLASFKDLVVVLLDPEGPIPRRLAARTNSAMRYTLTGSVRVEGDAIRLSARLVDRTNGSILWANSYDGSRTGRPLYLTWKPILPAMWRRRLGHPTGSSLRRTPFELPRVLLRSGTPTPAP